jgi:hypothetical protein
MCSGWTSWHSTTGDMLYHSLWSLSAVPRSARASERSQQGTCLQLQTGIAVLAAVYSLPISSASDMLPAYHS